MENRVDNGMGEDRLEFRVYAVSASGDALGPSRLKAGLQMARSRGFIRSATVSETSRSNVGDNQCQAGFRAHADRRPLRLVPKPGHSRAPAVRFRKRLSFNTQQSTFINRNSTLRRL